jgi:glycosyltransferase involved in cell wall biosynthesis
VKIAISACAADAGKSGIGQYIIEIVSRLSCQGDGTNEYVIFTEADNDKVKQLAGGNVQICLLSPFWSRTLPNLFWHLYWLPILLLLGGYHQVIYLAANRRLAWTPMIPSVGVVHDLSQLHIKGKYDRLRTFYVLQLLTRLMTRLSHCVCVSNATAKDVMEYAGVESHKVETIYNGADTQRFGRQTSSASDASYRADLGIVHPYILYTARLEHPGKNHIGLLRAFAILQHNSKMPLNLVFAGSRWTGTDEIEAEIGRLGLTQHVIMTDFVPNEKLPSLVQKAALFVMPSLFEGFGIPLVEAMAAGTPVCASRVASIPEVVGDAGLLFDPRHPEEMAQIMRLVLQAPLLATEMSQRGKRRATLFDWDISARQLYTASQRLESSINADAGMGTAKPS